MDPGGGISAVISTPALGTESTLTRGQLKNHAGNHASDASSANDAPHPGYHQPLNHVHSFAEENTLRRWTAF